MTKLKKILMKRDGLTSKEADELIKEAREELLSGNNDALMDILGLEDDYIFDLI